MVTVSVWCAVWVESLRESFRRAASASETRRSRDWWRVERESVTRVRACLSGWMLKLPIVWWISWVVLLV